MLSVEILTQQIKHGQILWAVAADNKLICTLIFLRRYALTLYANCLCREENLDEMSICFLEEIRKNIWKCFLLKFLPTN